MNKWNQRQLALVALTWCICCVSVMAQPTATNTPEVETPTAFFETYTPTPFMTPSPESTHSSSATPSETTTPLPCIPPQAPTGLFPPDDARYSSASDPATLLWNPVVAAARYEVELGIDPEFQGDSGILDTANPELDLGDYVQPEQWVGLAITLYWRVRAVDQNECVSDWSVTRYFSKTVIEAPILLWPENDARYGYDSVPARFEWTSVSEGGPWYMIELAADADFEESLGTALWSEHVLDLAALISGSDWNLVYGTYYWRVSQEDVDQNWGPWSEGRYFSRANLPAPALLMPFDGERLGARSEPVVFSWEYLAEAQYYQLQFASDGSFQDIWGTLELETSSLDLAPFLTSYDDWYRAYGQFYWRVAAVDVNGNHCPWSRYAWFAKNGRLRVIAYGDSITYGDGYPEGPGYIGFLEQMLIDHFGYAEVINEGNPGAKTYHGKINAEEVLGRNFAEYILMMFGTNDTVDPFGCTVWGEPYGCLVDENMRSVIHDARRFNTAPVLATIIPTNPEGNWPDPYRLHENNEKLWRMAEEEHQIVADLYEHFMSYGYIPPLFDDSLHLNADGYEWMAIGWYPFLLD